MLFLVLFFCKKTYSNCAPSSNGLGCVSNPILFNANAPTAVKFRWNFNNEGFNYVDANPAFSFSTTGVKTIYFECQFPDSSWCKKNISVTINPKPTIRTELISDSIQCFQGNKFCFKDSSLDGNGGNCLKSVKYLFSDNELITIYGSRLNPIKTPVYLCKTISDPQGAELTLTIEVEDCNGCISSYKFPLKIRAEVSTPLFTRSLVLDNACKGKATVRFVNLTKIDSSSTDSVIMNFGNGKFYYGIWDTIYHNYEMITQFADTFYPILKVKSKVGCDEIEAFNPVILYKFEPKINVYQDSICYGNPINFSIEPYELKNYLKKGSYLWYFNEGFSDSFTGQHWYSNLGPKNIRLVINHPCGNVSLLDTVLVIGPKAIIEKTGNYIEFNQRYQCQSKDTVYFHDISEYYHNDSNFFDDNAVQITNTGLKHEFLNQKSVPFNPNNIRKDDNILRLWSFGDYYCENCTTDTKKNKNVGINCRYSNDVNPFHFFPKHDSIYQIGYSTFPFYFDMFNKSTKQCHNVKLFSSDSIVETLDTLIYLSNLPLSQIYKDSNIFKKLPKDNMPLGMMGKTHFDIPFNLKLRIKNNTKLFIYRVINSSWDSISKAGDYFVSQNDVLVTKNNIDTVIFLFGWKYIEQTMSKNLVQNYHKIKQSYRNPYYNLGDSINPDLHRQFYFEKYATCFNASLMLRDTVHPFKCWSQTISEIAMMPPSAKNLNLVGEICLERGEKVVEFSLSSTKPSCHRSEVYVNFNYTKNPNTWQILNNEFMGEIMFGKFINSSDPYKGYQITGPAGHNFWYKYKDEDLRKEGNNLFVDVALITKNGTGLNTCQDTFFYPAFISFPHLKNEFGLVGQSLNNRNSKVCVNDSVLVYVPDNNQGNVLLTHSNSWYIYDFINNDTTEKIVETFHKVKNLYRFPNQKVNFTTINRFKNDVLYKTDTFVTAIVNSYKTRLLKSSSGLNFEMRVRNQGLNYYEFDDYELVDLIWNRVGQLGVASTGSKGCVDTFGIGSGLIFINEPVSITPLMAHDSILKPYDIHSKNNQNYWSYQFKIPQKGAFKIIREIKSINPTECPKYSQIKLVSSFDMNVVFDDTVLCKGNVFSAVPQFRYYSISDSTFGQLDTFDYWRMRISNAGNNGYEGITYWDLNKKDDDINNPNTIFGAFPYAKIGLGNPDMIIGKEPGAIYYNQAGKYLLRIAASDSSGCADTMQFNILVTDVRAQFKLDINNPNCKSILEFFDSSYILDPCALLDTFNCDNIISWTIDWGDEDSAKRYVKLMPKQIGNQYKKNGKYTITYKVESILGCVDYDTQTVVIPGPNPIFNTLTSRFICVHDSVNFNNFSPFSSSSSQWIWNFGDREFSPQADTGKIWHQYNKTGKFDVYLTQFDSIKGTGKYCSETYPDSLSPITIFVFPYDTIKLLSVPNLVCAGDSVLVIAKFKNPIFKDFIWQMDYNNPIYNQKDSIYFKLPQMGNYKIVFDMNYSGIPSYNCVVNDSIVVYADSIVSNFEIDSSKSPEFCFKNTSLYGVYYRWGFYHNDDVVPDKLEFLQNEETNKLEDSYCIDYKYKKGQYWICLEATNQLGCKDTVCKMIKNKDFRLILPPNAFTPGNKDNFNIRDEEGLEGNDYFNILINGHEFYHLRIYDRWGILVFESKDSEYDWNGRVQNTGNICPDGVYYYVLDYRFKYEKKNEEIINGVIHLLSE